MINTYIGRLKEDWGTVKSSISFAQQFDINELSILRNKAPRPISSGDLDEKQPQLNRENLFFHIADMNGHSLLVNSQYSSGASVPLETVFRQAKFLGFIKENSRVL